MPPSTRLTGPTTPGRFGLRPGRGFKSFYCRPPVSGGRIMLLLTAFGGLRRYWATQHSGLARVAGGRRRGRHRLRFYRPLVDVLEDRLPPGDAVLGGWLAWSWAEPGFSLRQ